MRGLYWWIDRWRSSSAYMDLDLECQGAYRNLLDEGCLRDGGIPNDPQLLARASGDAARWPKLQARVMRRFQLVDGAWHNDTLDLVLRESQLRADKQRQYRTSTGNPVASTPDERRRREAARGTARRALAKGDLVRQPCEVCGTVTVEIHHDDYDKPLDVRWLCKQHHDDFHNRIVPLRQRG